MPPKIYQTDKDKKKAAAERQRLRRQNQTREQKDAEANRKASKRSAEKEERELKKLKLMSEIDEKWISDLLSNLVFDVPQISEKQKSRREANARFQASKRSNIKKAANILPKRQAYAK